MEYPLEYILCVEGGYLERQAKLLIHSIRSLEGPHGLAPITAYQPRAHYKVSQETRQFFEAHQVTFIDLPLNREHRHYYFANKPIICAYHEARTQAQNVVYLDCDLLVYQPPTTFGTLTPGQIFCRPEDAHGYGTTVDFDDENGEIWQRAYQALDITHTTPVRTIRDYALVQPYYNAGHFAFHKADGFCVQWLGHFERMVREHWLPKRCFILSEQMAFSLTVTQMQLEVVPMETLYNFPANLWAFDPIDHPAYQNHSLDEVCTMHYHKIFLRGYNPLASELARTERGQQLNEKIEEFGLLKKAPVSLVTKIRRRYDDWQAHRKYSY